jgi:transcriptional regulator with XRE-family HTH domain
MQLVVCQTKTSVREAACVRGADRKARSEAVAARFGENLRRCRRLAALSQEELAARASLHRTEIGLLEHGHRVARVDTVVQLAGAMAIPPSDLLEGIHWTPGEARPGGFSFSESRGARRRGD